MIYCDCGWRFLSNVSFTMQCPQCKQIVHFDADSQQEPTIAPTPRWVRLVKRLRKSEDTGVGDTVQRIAATFGGERFKRFAERIGLPCGCTKRQSEWNRLYPYGE